MAFKTKMPQIQTQLCLFHVIRNFEREITTVKRNINDIEKKRVLAILMDMVYANSEEKYDNLYSELKSLNLIGVISYFDSNWHPIRDEWTMFGRNQYANYLNTTSNRVESLNQKIKFIVEKNSTLVKFFHDLSICLASLSSEKNLKAIKAVTRTKRRRILDDAEQKYADYLTDFAFQKFRHEYKQYEFVEVFHYNTENRTAKSVFKGEPIELSETTCECWFVSTMELPCRHILKLLSQLDEDLFVPEICATRWTRQYYKASHPILRKSDSMPSILQNTTGFIKVKTVAEVDKFKKCTTITKNICQLMSTLPNDVFSHYYKELEKI